MDDPETEQGNGDELIAPIKSCSVLADCSQDVPLNRFITYVFYEGLFILLLTYEDISPFHNSLDKSSKNISPHLATQVIILLYLYPAFVRMIWYLLHKRKEYMKCFFVISSIVRDIFLTTAAICNLVLYYKQDNESFGENGRQNKNARSNGTYHNWHNNGTTDYGHLDSEDLIRKTSVFTFAIGNQNRTLNHITIHLKYYFYFYLLSLLLVHTYNAFF